ncbi:MAG TPA: energy transducer TonB, partial [Pyrinomonadaceae bacterium]
APDAPEAPDPGPRGDGGVAVARGRGAGVGRASGGAVRAGGLSDGPLYAPRPEYPDDAKAAGAEGKVSVRVTVDEGGNVVAAEAVAGHPLLRPAAVGAARAAKFEPALLEGRPVKVSGVISYDFRLK